jgi:hypothetical protein
MLDAPDLDERNAWIRVWPTMEDLATLLSARRITGVEADRSQLMWANDGHSCAHVPRGR